MSKNEATNLKQIGEINEHVHVVFLLSTSDVKAHRNNVHALAAFSEFVLYSEGVHPEGRIRDHLRQAQHRRNHIDLLGRCTVVSRMRT